MKKLLLIVLMICIVLQTFSYSPANAHSKNSEFGILFNEMILQNLSRLTPKQYTELTGKKMTIKEKFSLLILRAKLKNQNTGEKAPHKTDLGLLSLIFGGAAFPIAFIPGVGIASLGLAIAAIVLGIIGLGRKRGDAKSIIGLCLGSAFFLLVLAAIAVYSGGWY